MAICFIPSCREVMKCVFHPGYQVPLPPGHPFPISKYPLLRDRLLNEGLIGSDELVEPEPIDLESAALVHTREYLEKLQGAALTPAEQRRLGLPWSAELWRRSRLAAGGTLRAARLALEEGLAANIAGGTHHAFADHAEGFCVLNDVAIAIARLRSEGRIRRAAIIDLDVHQGNGTAAIFEGVEDVFTFSMHGERNYPLVKMRSSLDVGLRDGTEDEEYLEILLRHLPAVLESARAELVYYVAGVDVARGDRYGKLALSEQGIRRRDACVIESVRGRGLPLTIVLGGGYAASRERTVALHALAFEEAVIFERDAQRP
jgi:acetoin utilization deacetylase AcuC-like enzyme